MVALASRAGPGVAAATPADYLRILKPRVMSLAVFTAVVGLVAAPVTVHPVVALASLLAIAAGAGAAGALNMWWDADIDRRMARTRGRPVAAGRIAPEVARNFGVGLALIAILLLGLFANPLAGALLALTIAHYLLVYTVFLKRRSVHSVVIGGFAGALPPVIGWAAATGTVGIEALLMFAVIFLWTPPHSWALALLRRDEYADVGVPTLPVAAGATATRCQILIYTVALVPTGVVLAYSPVGGPVTIAAALVSGVFLLIRTMAAIRPGAGRREEGRLFGFSIVYLFAIFASLLLDDLTRVLQAGAAG